VSRRHRSLAAFRLTTIIVLLFVAIWLLYRVYLQAPAAPPPPITRSEGIVSFRTHW